MGSITLGAVGLLLCLITPSLLALIVYRAFFPRSRSLPNSEGILLISSILIGWAINGHTISKYLERMLSFIPTSPDVMAYWSNNPILSTAIDEGQNYFDFFLSTLSFGPPVSDGFWLLTLMLHGRMLAVSFLLIGIGKLLGALESRAQLIPYRGGAKPALSLWDKILLRMAGLSSSQQSKEYFERYKIKFRILNWTRDLLLHPWTRLTLSNRSREILMVDVFTNKNDLYSGFLTSWIPKGDQGIGAIAMEYALRFEVVKGENGQVEYFRPELIKNNGELIVSAEQIYTVHFWEIRKGTEVHVFIKNNDSIERLKWYLILKHVFHDIVGQIVVQVDLSSRDFQVLYGKILDWVKDTNLEHVFDEIFFVFAPALEKEILDVQKALESQRTPPQDPQL